MVNIFIAYMLPDDKRKALEEAAAHVREVFAPEGKDEQFFHTTLLFIGRVEESWLPFIKEKMAEIAAHRSPIKIDINKIGYFYNARKRCIKVLYAVPEHIPDELNELCQQLYEAIGQPLAGKTTPPIAPARIHFTITKRLKRILSKSDFQSFIGNVESFSVPVNINNIGLYHCKDLEHRYYREICKYDFQNE
ncbi:MAG: 2'-5' RNA ligase family protein [Prevotella sp.]|jgi:2'-5' RNA ligase